MGIEMQEAKVKAVICDICGRELRYPVPIDEALVNALHSEWTVVGAVPFPHRVVCELDQCRVALADETVKLVEEWYGKDRERLHGRTTSRLWVSEKEKGGKA